MFITGFAGKALDDVELPAGMEVLRKPFKLDELSAKVRAMLARTPTAALQEPN